MTTPRQAIREALVELAGLETALALKAQYQHAKTVAAIRRWLYAALDERGTGEMPVVAVPDQIVTDPEERR